MIQITFSVSLTVKSEKHSAIRPHFLTFGLLDNIQIYNMSTKCPPVGALNMSHHTKYLVRLMFFRLLILSLSLAPIVGNAQNTTGVNQFSLKGSLFEKIGTTKNVDPYLLYSLGIAESGAGKTKGYIAPTPLTLRYNGQAFYFSSRSDAEQKLSEILKVSPNVDVGLMQINLRWHPHKNPNELFDAATNISVAADILKFAMASTADPILGVGRYHNWEDVSRGRWYGETVWQIYDNITK